MTTILAGDQATGTIYDYNYILNIKNWAKLRKTGDGFSFRYPEKVGIIKNSFHAGVDEIFWQW